MASGVHKVDISWERRASGVVAHVVYDYSRRLNAVNPPALLDLTEAFQSLAREDDLSVVVLSGAGGRALIGGADINHMVTMKESEDGRKFLTQIHKFCQAIRDCPVPVIARCEGYTLGAGLEVAAACDMRIAADNAFFGMPEVNVGLPSVVEAALLPRLIGWGRARWLVMTAENIDAPTALAWGLVDVVAPEGGLDAAVEHTVQSLLACGAEALRAQKALLRQWEDLPLKESVDLSIGVFGRSFLTDEPKRLMQAFIDRKR